MDAKSERSRSGGVSRRRNRIRGTSRIVLIGSGSGRIADMNLRRATASDWWFAL
jgi:hypothetical protein